MKSTSQLTLAVQLPDDETFASFLSGENVIIQEQLYDFIGKKNKENLASCGFYLFGATGSGKSHLLHASCAEAEEQGYSSLCLSFSDLKQLSVDILDGLEHIDLICLDDIQFIANNIEWQQAIFDLFNRLTEQNKRLIISGNCRAKELGITLPDLVSRLEWGIIEQVKVLTDEEKIEALQNRAKQRGIYLTDDVAKYLLNHLSRDMKNLVLSLDKLDKASIREQRKITIPFIKDVLINAN